MANPPKILVSGNTTLDIITICKEPYNLSGKRPVADYRQIPGGQAANVADLLASFGNDVSFVGAIGNDFAGKLVIDDFKRAGIEVLHSKFCAASHHLGFVRVDQNDGERFIDMYKAPDLNCADLAFNEEWVRQFDCIYFDGHEPELAVTLGKIGQANSIPVVTDLEFIGPHTNDVLQNVDVLIAPDKIIQELGAASHFAEATLNVYQTGYAAVVTTLGAMGCFGFAPNHVGWAVSGLPVKAIDTTGAGDAFHAAFVHTMLAGHSFAECMTSANKIAAQKCGFVGPRIPAEAARQLAPTRSDAPFDKEKWLRYGTRRNDL
jgi:sugar/nucleoside kinase (ribokinase family)